MAKVAGKGARVKRAFLVWLAVCSIPLASLAGAVYTNDTGEVAYGFRITFESPVVITSHAPVFPDQEPQGEATAFVFSGGEVASGASFWLSWQPAGVRVKSVEWLVSQMTMPPTTSATKSSSVPTICGVHLGGNWGTNMINVKCLPDEYFQWLKELHVNWVGISISLTVKDSMDASVEQCGPEEGIPTFQENDLRRLIRKLRRYGFHIYVTLAFENLGDGPPGKQVERWQLGYPYAYRVSSNVTREYWPWDSSHPMHKTFVREFFQSYTEQAVHFAKIAEEEGVELYSLGTETNWLFRTRSGGSQAPNHFREELLAMVNAVREVYHGALTYDLHYGALVNRKLSFLWRDLWDDLDFDVIGISAYFPLYDSPRHSVPTVESLRWQWERIFRTYIDPLHSRYPQKPIVFLEFGYVDHPTSSIKPNVNEFVEKTMIDKNENGLDDGEEEQANIYEAFFETMNARRDYFLGAFLWGNMIATSVEWNFSFGRLRTFSIRGKLAENVVKQWYSAWNPEGGVPPEPKVESEQNRVGLEISWDIIPYTVEYPRNPSVGFYCNGDKDISHARNWGKDGVHVRGFKAVLLDNGLAVRLDLYPDDAFGNYGYLIAFKQGSTVLYVVLRPNIGRADVTASLSGDWRVLGVACGNQFLKEGTSVIVFIPYTTFSSVIPPENLRSYKVDLHLDYKEPERRELFFFPGYGYATVLH